MIGGAACSAAAPGRRPGYPEGVDERLRSLEREAAHDPDAAARLILARVRSGALDERRLEVAAHLGHEPALRALGLARPAEPTDLAEWFGELARFGAPVLVRALVVAARDALPAFEKLLPEDPRPRVALDAVERWCDAPSTAMATRASEATRAAVRAGHDAGRLAPLGGEWATDAPEVFAAFHAAYLCKHAYDATRVQEVDAFVRALGPTGVLGPDPEADGADARLRRVVRAALVAWAIPAE